MKAAFHHEMCFIDFVHVNTMIKQFLKSNHYYDSSDEVIGLFLIFKVLFD